MGGVTSRRIALVTGASRGIGAAIARALAPDFDLALSARTAAALGATAEATRSLGARVHELAADLATPGGPAALLQQIQAAGLTIDVLVNNAGVAPAGPLARIDDETWARTLAVNLTAPFVLTRALAPDMARRGYGRVIHIASTSALKGYRLTAAYSASKAGLLGLTRAVAAELAGRGVTVNAVCPTFTDTDIVARAAADVAARTGSDPAEARRSFASFSPQGRLLDPDEVASLVAYLASDAARGIHGQALAIDGGETA